MFKVHKTHDLHTARTACAKQIQREREQEFRNLNYKAAHRSGNEIVYQGGEKVRCDAWWEEGSEHDKHAPMWASGEGLLPAWADRAC